MGGSWVGDKEGGPVIHVFEVGPLEGGVGIELELGFGGGPDGIE